MMGDSMMRQFFTSLSCYLGGDFVGFDKKNLPLMHIQQQKNISKVFAWGWDTFAKFNAPGNVEVVLYLQKNNGGHGRTDIIKFHTQVEPAIILFYEGFHHKRAQSARKAQIESLQACQKLNATCILQE